GQSEAEIAGHLAHRLIRHQVQPLRLQIAVDGRGGPYRHLTYGDQKLERWCIVAATGSRWGLSCAAARTVVLGSPPMEVVSAFQQAAALEATGIYFSLSGEKFSDTWQRVRRIYEKLGIPDEWMLGDQADVVGYDPQEVPLAPGSEFVLRPRV